MLLRHSFEGFIILGFMPFRVMILVAFIAKVLHTCEFVYVQTQHGLFFIDWEQPRTHKGAVQSEDDDEEKYGSYGGGSGGGSLPVSVWRTVFVANEWVKLQDARAISTELNLICLLFLLQVCCWPVLLKREACLFKGLPLWKRDLACFW